MRIRAGVRNTASTMIFFSLHKEPYRETKKFEKYIRDDEFTVYSSALCEPYGTLGRYRILSVGPEKITYKFVENWIDSKYRQLR